MARLDPALAAMTSRLAGVYGVLMTPKNVQDLLKCGRATAYEWLRDIPAVCVGKRKLYRIEDIAAKVLTSRERNGVMT